MNWKFIWDHVGRALASTAKVTAKGALWASDHSDVAATLATIAGHPEVATAIVASSKILQGIDHAATTHWDEQHNGK